MNGNRNWNRVEKLFVLQSLSKKFEENKNAQFYFLFLIQWNKTNHTFIKHFLINIIGINWNWNAEFLFFRLCSYRDVCFSCAFRRHQHPEIPFCSHKSFALTRRNLDSFLDSWSNWCDVSKHNPWANFYCDPSLVYEFWKIPISLELFFAFNFLNWSLIDLNQAWFWTIDQV